MQAKIDLWFAQQKPIEVEEFGKVVAA